jgi:hypothetical protein
MRAKSRRSSAIDRRKAVNAPFWPENIPMRGELTILGILMLAVAQWYASDSPRSRKIAYGLFGLAATVAVVLVARGSL